MQFPYPTALVGAEDVAIGKPNPTCFSLGRERIGMGKQALVLVVEDSPSGVRASKAAGCAVLAVATTHRMDKLNEAGADWIIKDLRSLQITNKEANGWKVSIANKWSKD